MSRAEPAARVVAVGLGAGLVTFQVALAAGAPWGSLAWGGQHPGTLPTGLRAGSAASAVIWAGAVAAAATSSSSARSRRACAAYGILSAVGTVMNALSPSPPERTLWTPVAGALALSFGVLARSTAGPPAR